MMVWPILNMTFGLIAAGIIAYRLAGDGEPLTFMERVGFGFVGAGMILTIGPVMFDSPTPFEDWSAALLRFGFVIFLIGQLLRHRHINAAMVRQARRHLKGKK